MPRSWHYPYSDVDVALMGGAAVAALLLLATLLVMAARSCCSSGAGERIHPGESHVASAADYETLQVAVQAHGHEAELEVSTDAFESYEEVCALLARVARSMMHLPYSHARAPCTGGVSYCAPTARALPAQTDECFESHMLPVPWQLRELVVDAVPNMFRDSDELTLEYMTTSTWLRVKRSTPLATVKAAKAARVIVHEEPAKGRRR